MSLKPILLWSLMDLVLLRYLESFWERLLESPLVLGKIGPGEEQNPASSTVLEH